MSFVDTDVLLCAVFADPPEEAKASTARGVLAERDLGLSTQVLQESYAQATRVSREDALTHDQAVDFVASLGRFPVQTATLELVHAAMTTRRRFDVSYWDAAIIEAARLLGCAEVLSEDLSHGQDFPGVVV